MKSVPPIKDFDDYRAFLRAFVDASQRADARFSFRYFARKLSWPVSYLNDVLAGRKDLSIARGLQLARLLALDDFDAERLILLILKSSEKEVVRAYSEERLSTTQDQSRRRQIRVDRKIFLRPELIAVHDLLRWARGPLSPAEISHQLRTFRDQLRGELDDGFAAVRRAGLVKRVRGGKLAAQPGEVVLDEGSDKVKPPRDAFKIHAAYAANYQRYLAAHNGPAMLHAGFIELPAARFPEFADKLTMIRNWLTHASDQAGATAKAERGETLLFQFGLHLFPLLDREEVDQQR